MDIITLAMAKKYTNSKISEKLVSVYTYKGTVTTEELQQIQNPTIGDVYNIEETGMNVAWTGTEWDELGGSIIVDNELIIDSTNPVQNQVIYQSINDLQSQIDDLNYKPITISSFTVNPNSAEKGSEKSVTVSWTLNKTPTSITLNGETLATSQISKTYTNINKTTTYSLTVTDAGGNSIPPTTKSQSASINFYNSNYYGVATEWDRTIMSSFLSSNRNKTITVNATEGKYIYYAYPSSYGNATFTVGGFEGGFSLISTQNVTNASGYTEEYKIYRSDNPSLGNTTVIIS